MPKNLVEGRRLSAFDCNFVLINEHTWRHLLFFIFLRFSLHQLTLEAFVLSPGSRDLGLRVSQLFTERKEKKKKIEITLCHTGFILVLRTNRKNCKSNCGDLILGMQPRDKAATLGAKTIKKTLSQNLHDKRVQFQRRKTLCSCPATWLPWRQLQTSNPI